jgi:hypothetical protein
MQNPGWAPGARENGHAKLNVRENTQRPFSPQELLVATIEKNSRSRFEIAICRRAGGCVRTELRVREQDGQRGWKDQARAISIDPELGRTVIAGALIKAGEIAARGDFARALARSEFSDARNRGARR